MTEAHETPQNHISRRSIAKGAVWAAPVVIASQTAAFAATSCFIFPHCAPVFNDQKEAGSQTNDLGNQQGNFTFIVPTGTKFPEIQWIVKIRPVENDDKKLIKDERKFEIKDLTGGGSTIYESFKRTNTTGPTRDPKTGVETITFTSPPKEITRGNGKTDTSIGFRVWVGGPLIKNANSRADMVTIEGRANGKKVVWYDSLEHSSPDRGKMYDGRI